VGRHDPSEQFVERLLHAPQVADVAPVDGVGVVAEVVVGQLPPPRRLGVDLRGARGVGGARVGLAHRGLRVDRDAVIQALTSPEAKRPADSEIDLESENNKTTL